MYTCKIIQNSYNPLSVQANYICTVYTLIKNKKAKKKNYTMVNRMVLIKEVDLMVMVV